MKDRLMRAAVGIDRGGDPEDPKTDGELKRVVPLIRDRVKVEPERLADEDVDLRRLVGRRSLMPDVEG